MVAELITGLSVFKSMLDMAKGLKDMNDAAVRNSAVIELQEKILAAQTQQSALVDTVRTLEEEVARLKAWDTEKERYELTPIGDCGVLAYKLKEGVKPPEAPHYLCANCYNHGEKSVLQPEQRTHGRAHLLVCHRCKAEIYTFGTNPVGEKGRAGTFGRQ